MVGFGCEVLHGGSVVRKKTENILESCSFMVIHDKLGASATALTLEHLYIP